MRKYNKYKCQTHESYVSHDVCIPVEIVEDFKKEYPFMSIKKNLRKNFVNLRLKKVIKK